MIVIRKIKNDKENIKAIEILRRHRIDSAIGNNNINFVLEDNEEIKGICNFHIINKQVILNFLLIDKNRRGEKLGDGLLRAVLNYCLVNGVEKAYFIGNNDYFIKKGFLKLRELDEDATPIVVEAKSDILVCNIEEFFSKDCSCKRG